MTDSNVDYCGYTFIVLAHLSRRLLAHLSRRLLAHLSQRLK